MSFEVKTATNNQPNASCDNDRLRSQWFVACPSTRLKDRPFAFTLLDTPLVLFRHNNGVTALLDRCPHRGAPLSAGRVIGETLQCPYHGWQFDACGACRFRPGVPIDSQSSPLNSLQTSVASYGACEHDGWVWVTLQPLTDSHPLTNAQSLADSQSQAPASPHLPSAMSTIAADSRDQLIRVLRWRDEVQSDWLDAIENLLDATHTPFVHAGLVRDPAKAQQFKARVSVSPTVIQAEYLGEGKQSGWISKLFERQRTVSYGRFLPPCVAQLEYRSKARSEFVLNAYFTPAQSGFISLHTEIFLPKTIIPSWIKRMVLAPLLRRVLRQDAQILRLQQENLKRHPATSFVQWEGDLIRGWIETWLRTGSLPEEKCYDVDLLL